LSRNGIIADFSYANHYNKYENGMFVRYDLKTLNGNKEGLNLFPIVYHDDDIRSMQVPVAVNFNDTMGIGHIRDSISTIGSFHDVQFVNASELVRNKLTVRVEGVSR
jgi:hypothetical protein